MGARFPAPCVREAGLRDRCGLVLDLVGGDFCGNARDGL